MTAHIEITSTIHDTRAAVRKRKLHTLGFTQVADVSLVDRYTLDVPLSSSHLEEVATMLANPVIQRAAVNHALHPERFDWAIEIGYLPGVTDNVATTTKECIETLLKKKLPRDEGVYTSQVTFLSGTLTEEDIRRIAGTLANPLIQRVHIKSFSAFTAAGGMGVVVPRVTLTTHPHTTLVDLLTSDDLELQRIGKLGIFDHDTEITPYEYDLLLAGSAGDQLRTGDLFQRDTQFFKRIRRGPLALDLTYMRAIRTHFHTLGRNPTDLELESIAQTWSEHCKHTIFADPLDDDVPRGLFTTYIKAATDIIRERLGKDDFCISVFKDNAGGIAFNNRFIISHKIETHNAPSALDGYGGAITGIVGVERDEDGFGLGALPLINLYGYCFASPHLHTIFYRDRERTQQLPSPRQTMDGVVEGVKVGSNCTGIPTHPGFLVFDERYGRPLVFVGTVGFMPKESAGRKAHEKQARPGDYIVMVGGRVGKDGIHGATFSSEALDEGSPATAVQIGDPITQKKFTDALIKEARDLGLYTSITDNGAGGLSCSVAEMARESGGCFIQLDAVPIKYAGLQPWEIWISESQERMTLAVAPEKWDTLHALLSSRGVESTKIGSFTNSGACVVTYKDETVMDITLDFLHNGLPPRPQRSAPFSIPQGTPDVPPLEDAVASLHAMLSRLSIGSFAHISQQYDHEVQAGSVLKPLQGRGRVNADATVTRPLLDSHRAVVLSHGINPHYGDIDAYSMAAAAIDTAVRNAVVAGAQLDDPTQPLALLDNFCWPGNDPQSLGRLKDACRACFDGAVAFGTPYISGKDSMSNTFKGFDAHGKAVTISVPPTLLISTLGVMDDARKAVSLDTKIAGDLVYVLGETHDEIGGSEYFRMVSEQHGTPFLSPAVPQTLFTTNKTMYKAYAHALAQELIASAVSVTRGGLAVALAKMSIAGQLGLSVSLQNLPGTATRDDYTLYSESQGRIVVTIDPEHKEAFEKTLNGTAFACIGTVTRDTFTINGREGTPLITTSLESLTQSYRTPFKEYSYGNT